MNQTLQNTKLAGAVTAMALLCALLLAEPVPHHRGADPGAAMLAAGSHAVGGLGRDLARDLDQQARRLEADLAAAGPAGEALAMASAAVAGPVVDTTLAALLDGFATRTRPAASDRTDTDARAGRELRIRSAMAMPYFATASVHGRGIGE